MLNGLGQSRRWSVRLPVLPRLVVVSVPFAAPIPADAAPPRTGTRESACAGETVRLGGE
jgi:hypothetical protein